MNPHSSHRLIILSGPSGVGKSPLDKALQRLYPAHHRSLQKIVLHNSRAPRPGEVQDVDYHFDTRERIEARRRQPDCVVLEVRGDLQALDLKTLDGLLQRGPAFFEGNPAIGRLLQTHPALAKVPRLSIFMSPLSREEILFLKGPVRHVVLADLVTDVMRRKLLRRTQRQKGILSLKDLENIERRARSAYGELKEACHFDFVIPNHDGEDSENWEAFYYPLGDARRALEAFVQLLENQAPPSAEHWEADLLP